MPSSSSLAARRLWLAGTGAELLLIVDRCLPCLCRRTCCLSAPGTLALAARTTWPWCCHECRGFTPYLRDDYLEWKREGRLVNDGVNAKVRRPRRFAHVTCH